MLTSGDEVSCCPEVPPVHLVPQGNPFCPVGLDHLRWAEVLASRAAFHRRKVRVGDREPKVRQLDVSLGRDEDVGGLDVPVDDAHAVAEPEGGVELSHPEPGRLPRGQLLK